MTTEEISIVVNGIAVLISPIIAVIVSMWINNKNQKKKHMVDIFKTLMTTRNRPATLDYVNAINSIDVFFYGNEEVRKSLKELRDEYSKAIDMQKVRNKQLKLIEEIAKSLNYYDITWDKISDPYYPDWLVKEDRNSEEFKRIQMELLSIALKQQEKNNHVQAVEVPSKAIS
jgi:hypothetical protein